MVDNTNKSCILIYIDAETFLKTPDTQPVPGTDSCGSDVDSRGHHNVHSKRTVQRQTYGFCDLLHIHSSDSCSEHKLLTGTIRHAKIRKDNLENCPYGA